MTPSQALPAVLEKIDADFDNSLARLFDFLRIQSISTDPLYKEQCRAAADFVAKDLSGLGFAASVRPTGGHPVVIAKAGCLPLSLGDVQHELVQAGSAMRAAWNKPVRSAGGGRP